MTHEQMYCETCGRGLNADTHIALIEPKGLESTFKRFCCDFCLLMHTLRVMNISSFSLTQGGATIHFEKEREVHGQLMKLLYGKHEPF